MFRHGLLALLALLCVSCSGLRGPMDAGPLYSRDQAPDGPARWRFLGPIGEWQQATNGQTFAAVRPFYSRVTDPANHGRCLQDFLWPVAMHKEFNHEIYWRVLLSFGHDFDARDAESRWRMALFPFVFAGQDARGEGYFGVFPLGGDVHEVLGRDRIVFALFPLWMYTAINEVRTHDVLFPIFSRTVGDRVSRSRVFPLYGESHLQGKWHKRFVLWPLWTSVRYTDPKGPQGGGFILFPLVGHMALDDQRTWMVIPPFFRWSRNDEGYRAVNCPWPFFQYRSGKQEWKLSIWPLWGRRKLEHVTTSYALWPVINTYAADRGTHRVQAWSVLPLLYHEKRTVLQPVPAADGSGAALTEQAEVEGWVTAKELGDPPPAPADGRSFKLWPVFSYRRDGQDFRLRCLELWPGGDLGAIERNYAPFWRLYSHVRVNGGSEDELLWGLWRRQNRSDGARHWSVFPLYSRDVAPAGRRTEWRFLMGLVGYRREGLQRQYQLLYFMRFRRNGTEPPPPVD